MIAGSPKHPFGITRRCGRHETACDCSHSGFRRSCCCSVPRNTSNGRSSFDLPGPCAGSTKMSAIQWRKPWRSIRTTGIGFWSCRTSRGRSGGESTSSRRCSRVEETSIPAFSNRAPSIENPSPPATMKSPNAAPSHSPAPKLRIAETRIDDRAWLTADCFPERSLHE